MEYTDSQASKLSGVPERSLRLLQTCGLLTAVQAAKGNGGFVRTWAKEDVLVAAIVQSVKQCTNLSYVDISARMVNCKNDLRKAVVLPKLQFLIVDEKSCFVVLSSGISGAIKLLDGSAIIVPFSGAKLH